MVAAPEALEVSERRIVIDHHRRAADFIENPLLTYLEPAASSTSELVTELCTICRGSCKTFKSGSHRYLCGHRIRYENFNQQTGARTLKRQRSCAVQGADIERVKELFIETFDSIQLRAKMVFEANRTEGIAISVAPAGMKDRDGIGCTKCGYAHQ